MSKNKRPIAIKVNNVSKDFVLPHHKRDSLKSTIIHPFSRTQKETQRALNGVSFEIEQGEFFGIVGRNGSGKSTLLKILAGVYEPTDGDVEVNGSLVPFIELGVGFNPELSGRDNVYLNGSLLGFSRKEISEMYDSIVEFAELEKFMDQKLKNYSSGMQVRLAFSIAVRAKSSILLIDEVLAVGDESFQRKCFEYFEELKNNKAVTVVFVSHDMDSVERFCSKAVLIEDGEVIKSNNVAEVVGHYHKKNRKSTTNQQTDEDNEELEEINTEWAEFSSVTASKKNYRTDSKSIDIDFDINIKNTDGLDDDLIFGVALKRKSSGVQYWTNSAWEKLNIPELLNQGVLKVTTQIDNIFPEGEYSIDCVLQSKTKSRVYARIDNKSLFRVERDKKNKYQYHPKSKMHAEFNKRIE